MALVDAEMHGRVLDTRQNVGSMMHFVNLQIKGAFFFIFLKNMMEKVTSEECAFTRII